MKKKREVRFSRTEFYFDDCPICRAMKKAEEEGRNLGFEELKEAFAKTKRKNRKFKE